MRKDPFFVDDYVHVYNRGNRKQEIVRDEKDRWHFLQMLFYFNHKTSIPRALEHAKELLGGSFYTELVWPSEWPTREPIVKILAFVLVENHFHLLLKEIKEGGISLFMKKIGNSMSGYFNAKHKETGRLFQGSYKAKRIKDDNYLRYLSMYIQVKNTFEMYPGGFKKSIKEFDKAFEFAIKYKFGSLSCYVDESNIPVNMIIDKDMLETAFVGKDELKEFARSYLTKDEYVTDSKEFKKLLLD